MSTRTWTAPVAFRPGAPTVRVVAKSLHLVENVDWTWERGAQADADGHPTWWLTVAAEHAQALTTALDAAGYSDLTFLDGGAQTVQARVLMQALARRLAPLLPKVRWTDAAARADVLTAAARVEPMAPSYRDASGAWSVEADDGRLVLHVTVDQTHPSWGRAVPGAHYSDRGALTVMLERLGTVARALQDKAPTLAATMLRAYWIDNLHAPADTDWLCTAASFHDLHPDLRLRVQALCDRIPPARGLALRDYQQIAIAFAAACGGRALIGDAPGVGKTAVAIGFLKRDLSKHTPALVVAPASVQSAWEDETRMWARGLMTTRKVGVDVPVRVPGALWVTSWAKLKDVDVARLGIRTVIFDEAHYAKHEDSLRAQHARNLAASVPHVLELTGTPLENRVGDLWNLLSMLGTADVGEKSAFVARYGSSKKKVIHGVSYVDDDRNAMLPELRDRLRGSMLRRLKVELAMELPDKTRVNVWADLPPDVRGAYDDAEQNIESVVAAGIRRTRARKAAKLLDRGYTLAQAVREANDMDMRAPLSAATLAIVVLGHMRRLIGEAKVAQAAAWIHDFAANGEPIVVFVEHRNVRERLLAALAAYKSRPLRASFIDGSVPADKRGPIVKQFQSGALDVLVCGLRSANTGITLHRASTVLFVERGLVPAQEEQAEDRVWRSGQKNACTAYYLMVHGTVDERLDAIATGKRALSRDVLRSETVGESTVDAGLPGVQLAERIFLARVESALRDGVDARIVEADVRAALREAG